MKKEVKNFKKDLKELRNPPKNSTISVYGWHIERFLEWFEEQNKVTKDSPGTVIVNKFAEDISEKRDWERGTTYVCVEAVRRFLSLEWQKDVNVDNLKNPGKHSEYEPIIFEWDQIEDIFDVVDQKWGGDQKRAMFYLSWSAALRPGETVIIQDRDFNFQTGEFEPRILKGRGRKKPTKKIPSETMTELGAMELAKKWVGRGKNYTFFKNVTHPKKPINYQRRFLSGEWSSMVGDLITNTLGISRTKHLIHNFFRDTRLTRAAENPKNDFLDILMLSGHSNPGVALKYFERAGREVSSELKRKLKTGWSGRK